MGRSRDHAIKENCVPVIDWDSSTQIVKHEWGDQAGDITEVMYNRNSWTDSFVWWSFIVNILIITQTIFQTYMEVWNIVCVIIKIFTIIYNRFLKKKIKVKVNVPSLSSDICTMYSIHPTITFPGIGYTPVEKSHLTPDTVFICQVPITPG